MNYALKLNSIIASIWPQNDLPSNHIISQQKIVLLDQFLTSLSLNQFHQIIELSSQNTLFIVLQKFTLIINKNSMHSSELLKQINTYFRSWVVPQFPYNLKRSYDKDCLESYFQGSIGKIFGKILKEISKSNTQPDWNMISEFIISLDKSSQFYQILIISGYFSEIQSLQEDFEQYDSVREILKNFEYEVIPKVMQIVVKNISFCKETLQMVEFQAISSQLQEMNLQYFGANNDLINPQRIPQNGTRTNQSKLKYLKMNFEILRKIVEFNYHLEFQNPHRSEENSLEISVKQERKKTNSFPEYIIRIFLENDLIKSLYEVTEILISFKQNYKDNTLGFGEIVLDLLNKIIRTKLQEMKIQLKIKFMRQILTGQFLLMKKIITNPNIKENFLIKIIRSNIKVLKNISLKEILAVTQGRQWLNLTANLIETIMLNRFSQIDTQSYLIYKTISLMKQIVYQIMLYEIPSIDENLASGMFVLALKVQARFLQSFVGSSRMLQKNRYYNLEDLKTKRDRHFHNFKTLSHVHLPQISNLLQSILTSISSVQSAANFLLLCSYLIQCESLNCSSYFYLCHNQEIEKFKKLTIGNGIIIMIELLKQNNQQSNVNFQDAIFLFIEKVLQLYLEHEVPIFMAFDVTDSPLQVDSLTCQLISNKSKLLMCIFFHILQIIHIKTLNLSYSKDENLFHPYFQIFIKYLTHFVNQKELIDSFQIIAIQCEIKQHFIELKNLLRTHFKYQERKYLSEISLLLNHEPQSAQLSLKFKQTEKKSEVVQSQIVDLQRLLQFNPNDWIGVCYQIAGFLQMIDDEKTYFKIITMIGSYFFQKIFMSCTENINYEKFKLLNYFVSSFLNFTEDQKIKNLNFLLQFIKPIFFTWIKLFKIFNDPSFEDEGFCELFYLTLKRFLQNQNLNFFMLIRYSNFRDIIQTFSYELITFLSINLHKKSIIVDETALFRVVRVIFRSFRDFFLEDKVKDGAQKLLRFILNLIVFVKDKILLVNTRKYENLFQLIQALKSLQIILEYFSEITTKYSYKIKFVEKVRYFIDSQQNSLKVLSNELEKFTANYEKYIRFSSQKYRRSQMDLLLNLSKLISQICGFQKGSNIKENNHQSTMSSSQEDDLEGNGNYLMQKENEGTSSCMNSLEKQFIWLNIEGKKQITEY